MYLKRVVLHGFKSFADRTVVDLEHGVTAIVGPNGCGKSNIADAIKWVLGEQSPKSLRATSMQDVLFEGADTRPAMSFCEVTLTFAECEAQLGTAFAEVEVARRVERDGGSDYFINGKACRLKDIQALFRDTGIGRVSYSFLQQGQIDKLISSNPLDRRMVFEEAAGISGFKAKREETLKKLGETETNLSRVSDILSEVASSMTSLKRQASKAVRAARLKRQVSALEQALTAYDFASLTGAIAAKEVEIAPAAESLQQLTETLSAREATLKTVEGEVGELLAKQQTMANGIFEVKSAREEATSHARFLTLRAEETSTRLESLKKNQLAQAAETAALKEQEGTLAAASASASAALAGAQGLTATASQAYGDAQKSYEAAIAAELDLKNLTSEQEGLISSTRARLGALELEAHGLKAQQGPIAAQRESLTSDRARVADEAASKQAQLNVANQNKSVISAELDQTQREVVSLKNRAEAAKTEFDAAQRSHMEKLTEKDMLAALNKRYEGFGEATKKLLAGGEYVALVDGLEVAPEAVSAVAPAGLASLANLTHGERVALTGWTATTGETPALDGLTPAASFVKASPAFEFIRARLEGAYVCSDPARFAAIVEGSAPASFAAVASTDGAMVDARGLYSAPNAVGGSASFLDRTTRLKELSAALESSQARLTAAQSSRTEIDHAATDAEAKLSRLKADLAAVGERTQSLAAELKKIALDAARFDEQIARLAAQTSTCDARLAQIETERTSCQQKFDELNARYSDGQKKLEETQGALTASRSARETTFAALTEAKLKEASARHDVESAAEALKNIKSRLGELDERARNAAEEAKRLAGDLASYTQQAAEKNTLAAELATQLEGLNAAIDTVKAELVSKEGAQSAERASLQSLRDEANVAQEALMRLKLALNELTTRRTMLVEDFARRSTADVASLDWRASMYEAAFVAKADEATLDEAAVTLPSAEELAAQYPSLDREGVGADCSAARAKLDGIGPINENALEDYRAQEARYTTLKTQSDDLNAAKTELATALAELNEQSATLFNTTFATIRTNFQKTFEGLFGGGKADLVLTTPEDPLNSGIEIMARPPGTQLKTLGLLSGGQKTMTAVALLFAIYQVKPSPFCVLDELDAPLDEANIGRFLDMLRGFTAFSQFLIITHNKRTMASSSVIYGVTMQERGVSRLLSMRLAQAETYSQPSPKAEESSQETSTSVTLAAPTEAAVDAPAERVGVYSLEEIEAKAHAPIGANESEEAKV